MDGPLRLASYHATAAERLPRRPLVQRPTPVRRLDGIGRALGIGDLWLKDDSGGPPVGGNKARKLELLVADALRRACRTLVTVGYLGTNHGLATALAAREAGLDVSLVLVREVATEHVRDTLLRCAALGASLHYAANEVMSAVVAARVLAGQKLTGGAPYWVPPGGSSPLGTLGYVEAGLELGEQIERGELPEPSRIYVPLGSAGTSAGLALGLAMAGVGSRVCAVRVVSPTMASKRRTVRLARATWRQLRTFDPSIGRPAPQVALEAIGGFEGPGYGTETPEALDAIRLARDADDLHLEVTYTGRTLACLMRHARDGLLDGPTLLWNTFHPRGDLPADAPHWQQLPRAFHGVFG